MGDDGAVAPQLAQPPVAPAPRPVGVIAHRVLLEEVLVVLLRRPELARLGDLRHHRILELLLDDLLRRLRRLPLRLVEVEDPGAVLVAAIAELPARRERIDRVPEDPEQ